MSTFELLLFAGVLFLALINAASLVWAFYLNQKLRQKPIPRNYDVHIEGSKVFKEIEVDEVEKEAVDDLHKIVSEASGKLRTALESSTQEAAVYIHNQIKETADTHIAQFQQELTGSLEHSKQLQTEFEQSIADKRQLIEEVLRDSARSEYAKKLSEFDTKLSDVVSSYIIESLGTNANVDAQIEAIIASLESHKEEIKQDIAA